MLRGLKVLRDATRTVDLTRWIQCAINVAEYELRARLLDGSDYLRRIVWNYKCEM